MISVRTCNFWDSFCTVVPVLGFSLFLPGEKSPSTIVLSKVLSTLLFYFYFFYFRHVCVCVRATVHTWNFTYMYVCTTYHVLRIFLLLAQTCVHTTLLYKTLLLVTVTYYCSASCLPKRWRCVRVHRGYLWLYHTQLMHRYGYELHIVYNSRSAPMLKWSEGYPQDGILSVGNSERFGIDKHFITWMLFETKI